MHNPRRRVTRYLLAAGGAATILLAAACSSSSSSTSATSSGAQSSTGSTSTSAGLDQAAIALLPKSFPAGSTLRDGLEANQPPFEFVNSSGQLDGVDVQLAKAISAHLGLKIALTNVNFATLIPGVQSGRYDLSTSGFGDSTIREQAVTMIDYATIGNSLLVKAGNPLHLTTTTACGLPVAMLGNSEETEVVAPGLSKTCTAAGKSAIQVVSTQTSADPVVAVSSGRADAALMTTSEVAFAVSQDPGKFQLAPGGPVSPVWVAIAMPKNSPLIPAFLKALTDMKADGSYQAVLSKFGIAADAVQAFQTDAAGKGAGA
jgi:polar amino acid transport system substrate-binding protein